LNAITKTTNNHSETNKVNVTTNDKLIYKEQYSSTQY